MYAELNAPCFSSMLSLCNAVFRAEGACSGIEGSEESTVCFCRPSFAQNAEAAGIAVLRTPLYENQERLLIAFAPSTVESAFILTRISAAYLLKCSSVNSEVFAVSRTENHNCVLHLVRRNLHRASPSIKFECCVISAG